MSACSGPLGISLGRRNALDQLLQQLRDAQAGLGADQRRIFGRDADDLFDFMDHFRRIRRRQIDLVDDRQHLQALLQRGVAVGDALRLDALRGIDHQQRAFAGGERARYLVGEIDVSRRIDEIELIHLAAQRLEAQGHALRLDGDAALALEVHRVEHLGLHFPGIEAAAFLNEAVGQRRFAVINMSDDGEVADILHQGPGAGANLRLYRSAVVSEGLMHFFGSKRPWQTNSPQTAAPESCVRSARAPPRRCRRRSHRAEYPRAAGSAASSASSSSHRPQPGREYSKKRT